MTSWYYKIDEVEHGPVSQDDLVKMVRLGRLSSDDLVRIETKKKWYKARAVKGLKFPDEKESHRNDTAKKKPAPDSTPAPSATSVEASSLLKNLKKKGSDQGESVEVDSWETQDKASSKAVMSRAVERKPLDRTTKRVLWITAAAVLLLVLFPPHQVPADSNLPTGRYTTFLFIPPRMKWDVLKRGVGTVNLDEIKREGNKVYVLEDLPINWIRLLLFECLGVIVVAGMVFGFLAARKAAAEVPDRKPAHPPRRRAV